MALRGTKKAALLLMSLDAGTAGELLKSVKPEFVTEIAAELAYLESRGSAEGADSSEPVREFMSLLEESESGGGSGPLLGAMLENAVGKDRSRELLGKAQQLLAERDPFRKICSSSAADIAEALAGEPSQVIALVLAELPAKKGSQLLGLLADDVRPKVVCRMAGGDKVPAETGFLVARTVQKRLSELPQQGADSIEETGQEGHIRRLALLLRDLKKEARDELIAALSESDEGTGTSVQEQMVIWEDLIHATERPLQEILRLVNGRTLALALVNADIATVERIRANMSQRGVAMLDEEASLLSSPKQEEIDQAREAILTKAREAHAEGDLTFEEPE